MNYKSIFFHSSHYRNSRNYLHVGHHACSKIIVQTKELVWKRKKTKMKNKDRRTAQAIAGWMMIFAWWVSFSLRLTGSFGILTLIPLLYNRHITAGLCLKIDFPFWFVTSTESTRYIIGPLIMFIALHENLIHINNDCQRLKTCLFWIFFVTFYFQTGFFPFYA